MHKISIFLLFLVLLISGCAQTSPSLDSDSDGVPNYMDICKNTPTLASVDKFGCALDSDHDGVINLYDKCLHTSILDIVNKNGCKVK